MKFKIFLLLNSILFLHNSQGMENNTEHTDKQARTDEQILFQPKSLRDRSAQIVFKLVPQQPDVKATCKLMPSELIEAYINKPVDPRGRTPIYFAGNNCNEISSLIMHDAHIITDKNGTKFDVSDKLGITPIQYFVEEGNCDAAITGISVLAILNDKSPSIPNVLTKVARLVDRTFPFMDSTDKEEILSMRSSQDNALNKIIKFLPILKKYQSYAYVEGNLQPWHLTQRTTLFYAQTPEEIELIAQQYPDCDLDQKDIWGDTALLYHLKECRPACAQALIKAGATTKLCDSEGKPLVIDYCIRFGYNDLLKELFTQEMIEYLDEHPQPFMQLAAKHNNIGAIRFLLEKHLHSNTKDLKKALLETINQNNLPLCQLLSAQPTFNINTCYRYPDNDTLLIHAIRKFPAFALYLLDNPKIDIFQQNDEHDDALAIAMQQKNLPIFKKIVLSTHKQISSSIDPDTETNNINYQNDIDETPLMLCLREEFDEGIQFLLDQKADLYLTDIKNKTALHYAVKHGSCETFGLLFAHITSQCSQENAKALLSAKDKKGKTALMRAIPSTDESNKFFRALLPQSDIHAQTNKGKSVLHLAVENLSHKAVKSLLNAGCNLNLSTVIRLISQHLSGMKTSINIIYTSKVSYQATKSYIGLEQKTTIIKKLIKIVQLFINNGMNIDMPDEDGDTLLITAIKNLNPEMVQGLLQLGADAHYVNPEGKQPLLIAQEQYNIEEKKYNELQPEIESSFMEELFDKQQSLVHCAQEIFSMLAPHETT